MLEPGLLTCTRCGTALPQNTTGLPSLAPCPVCGAELQWLVFPALGRSAKTGAAPQSLFEAGEAACFYHGDKRAVVPCGACGRFLCSLCDIELEGRHLCPACVEAAGKKGHIQSLERRRIRYDQVVWSLLILPLPFCMLLAPLTATAAIVLSVIKWRASPSRVANTRLRLALGVLVALAELGVTALFWGKTFYRF
ncbi:MAG TPA: hypothetical protein VG146_11540 [Verrucomicrobiae bacterium]|nr:hypothetical protein [Verrucomicrobiae bacterium]